MPAFILEACSTCSISLPLLLALFCVAVLGQFVVCDDEKVCQALSGAFDFNMMIVSQVSL